MDRKLRESDAAEVLIWDLIEMQISVLAFTVALVIAVSVASAQQPQKSPAAESPKAVSQEAPVKSPDIAVLSAA